MHSATKFFSQIKSQSQTLEFHIIFYLKTRINKSIAHILSVVNNSRLLDLTSNLPKLFILNCLNMIISKTQFFYFFDRCAYKFLLKFIKQ